MPPEIVFLDQPATLGRQVAAFLLRGRDSLPIDLSDTQVWVPTAGAARRIRAALADLAAERGTGVLSPLFIQPMQALLIEDDPLASRAEREAAWLAVLRDAATSEKDQLLPDTTILESASNGLGVAGMLCDLCDLLAEGGLSPEHPSLQKVCAEDEARWGQLQPLYLAYLRCLAESGLTEPNETRLRAIVRPALPVGSKRVVVACIPDLAQAAALFLGGLARKKNVVSLLIWNPGNLPGGWDAWGRPLPDEWKNGSLEVLPSQIAVLRQADGEASAVCDFLAAANPPGDYSVGLADETLGAELAGEITRRGGVPFLPEGRLLAVEEAARIALGWDGWLPDGDLRVLRTLLQLPHFNRWLGNVAGLYSSQLLSACDYLIVEPIAETLGQAREFLATTDENPKRKHPAADWARTLCAALEKVRNVGFWEILEIAWERSTDGAEAARRVREIWDEIAVSDLFSRWPEGRPAAFARALRAERSFESAPEGSVELTGWLETPWLEASRLAICGCVEGRLPTSLNAHPFLPDSKRAPLGLQDNARRLARDAYLLSCLLARHRHGEILLSFSRFDAEGSPALPSRLLLRTSDETLPSRVLHLFGSTIQPSQQPGRVNGWRWSLPETLRRTEIERISATHCRDYLACPTRFYWKHVLQVDRADTDPREMDPRRFGILLHHAVEMFGRNAPDESKAATIEKFVIETFENEARRLFGPSPTAAIRVQLESGRVRLRAFARVQAKEYAAGWRILEVEKKIAADAEVPLTIGPLKLSAKVDRIEMHPELGLRILDYKTNAKPPEKTHFAPSQPEHFLPESQVLVRGKPKTWNDLQLPIYRFIASRLFAPAPIQAAYFLLPPDPAETKVSALDLDDEIYEPALVCAKEIANRIYRGVFWPAQPHAGNWEDPFGALFLNGAPEDCFDAATSEFLKGRP